MRGRPVCGICMCPYGDDGDCACEKEGTTMTPQDTMRLALEALEYHTEQTRPIHKTNAAIEALKAALSQQEAQNVSPLSLAQQGEQQPLEYWNAVEGWVSVKPDARSLQKLREEAYKRTDMIYREDPDTMFSLGFDAGFAAHGIGVQK